MKKLHKICPICGDEFIPKTSWVCCSRPCSIFFQAKKRMETAYFNYKRAEQRFEKIQKLYKEHRLPFTKDIKVSELIK